MNRLKKMVHIHKWVLFWGKDELIHGNGRISDKSVSKILGKSHAFVDPVRQLTVSAATFKRPSVLMQRSYSTEKSRPMRLLLVFSQHPSGPFCELPQPSLWYSHRLTMSLPCLTGSSTHPFPQLLMVQIHGTERKPSVLGSDFDL